MKHMVWITRDGMKKCALNDIPNLQLLLIDAVNTMQSWLPPEFEWAEQVKCEIGEIAKVNHHRQDVGQLMVNSADKWINKVAKPIATVDNNFVLPDDRFWVTWD